MISVKVSASRGATLCHITWVSEKPCSSNSGGPLPPSRAKIRPERGLIHSAAYPGNRSARSGMELLLGSARPRLPADVAAAEPLRPADAVDRLIRPALCFGDVLAQRTDIQHAPAIGDNA